MDPILSFTGDFWSSGFSLQQLTGRIKVEPSPSRFLVLKEDERRGVGDLEAEQLSGVWILKVEGTGT
jgi:hypothetical protein